MSAKDSVLKVKEVKNHRRFVCSRFSWLAGAFDIDDEKWKKHIVRMEGTRDSIVGLPKELTKTLLEKIKHPEKEWDFGDDVILAKKLFSLVVSGKKIAAVGLYEKDSDVPKPGDKARIINPNGDGFCLVEYVKVEVGSFLEVGMDFIRKEGEGDGNVEEWREKHRKFFGKETDDFLVVCEEFKLIEKS